MPHIEFLPSQLTTICEMAEPSEHVVFPRTPYLEPTIMKEVDDDIASEDEGDDVSTDDESWQWQTGDSDQDDRTVSVVDLQDPEELAFSSDEGSDYDDTDDSSDQACDTVEARDYEACAQENEDQDRESEIVADDVGADVRRTVESTQLEDALPMMPSGYCGVEGFHLLAPPTRLDLLAAAAQQQTEIANTENLGKRARGSPTDMDEFPAKMPRLDTTTTLPQTLIPTPVSPSRCFSDVLAEYPTYEGKWYKVRWHESWVHETHLPDIEPIRERYFLDHGRLWEIRHEPPKFEYWRY